MPKKARLFTALLLTLVTLFTPKTQANPSPATQDALIFSTTTVPNGLYGSAYTPQPLTVTGGTAPYTFSVSSGALPPGMALSTDGILSGTPTAAGTYSFTVTALDATPAPDQVSGTQTYTLVVDKAALAITATSTSKLYGSAIPTLGATYSGFVNGDNSASLTTQPSVTTTATAASPIGPYPISASGAVDPNYTITYNPGTLTITPAPLSITADDKSITYGGAVPALTVSYAGFVNGDNANSLTLQPTVLCLATSLSPAGTYPITVALAVDLNYTITYQPGTLTIIKAVLTATADNKTMPLGGPVPALTFSYSGFVNLDNALLSVTTAPTIATTATATSAAGSYPITLTGGSAANYTFSYVNAHLTVGTAVLTITALPASSVYGAALVPNGSLTVSYSGFVNGDGPASLTTQPTVTNTAVAGSPAGGYTLTPTGATSTNYTIQYVTGTYTISPAALAITAVNKTMTYGGAVPALTATYVGFVNGDNAASLTTAPTISTTATPASAANTYPITATGAVDPNYTITYNAGTMTVGKATLTITALPAGSVYGAALVPNGSLTVSYSGFVNGDGPASLTTQPTVTNTAVAGSPAGAYTLTPAGATSLNYTIAYVTGTYTISPAALAITAVNKTMTYGGAVPALTATYVGFVNGDNAASLTTAPTISTTATPASAVNTYPITATGAVDPNYTITYNAGTMTVGKATLTVTADDQTMPLGGPLPPLTVSYTGFVNGDNVASLTTAPTATTTATATSPAGSYPITPAGGTAGNYTFIYVNGTLSVGKALLTITALPAGSVYGAALVPNGSLTVSYNGFVNGDGPASLTSQPTVTNTAVAGSPAGAYTLTPAGAASLNYTIAYVTGTYTISPAALAITAVSKTMTYGGAVPALTATYVGFVNGDNAASLTTAPTISTTATPASAVNTYPITATGALDPNYTITYNAGTMTVGKATLTATADNKTMPLGGPLPPLTVSYTGFVNGDDATSLTTQPTVATAATATSPAGSYPITIGGGVSPNYIFSYVTGILNIGKAVLTITANPAGSVYGAALVPNGSLTVSYNGFVNGDGPGNLTAQPTVTNTAFTGAPAGSYALIPSGAVSADYNIQYVNGAYTISPVALAITAVNQTMTYGGAVPALTVSYSGFVNGDNSGRLTTQPTITTTATAASPAGTYPITASGAVDPNYTITYNAGTMTVGKATLTITADSKGMPLGGPLPALTVSYLGFVNGDNAASLTTQPSLSVPATASSPAGAYTITPSGATSPNYTFIYVNGTLAVGKALLTITANPAGSAYGAALAPAGSLTVSYSGFVNGDGPGSLTQLPVVTNTAVAGGPAGTYALIPSGAATANYVINYVNGTYTISQVALAITAVNQTMTYGGTVPALTATYSGFVNGDNVASLTTRPTITTAASPTSPQGTYPITASGAVDPNYTITYTTGTMTVQRATLTVTPNPASMTYGGALPALTASYSGFLNGDNAAGLTTKPTVTTTATASSPAGTYPITASGAAYPNYNIVYNPGTLTINPAALHITAKPQTKKYGTPDPDFTYTAAGLLNGDNTSIFSGSLSRTPGENVGIYPITAGSLSAGGNYTISFTGSNLTITIGSQQIAWGQSLVVGCNAVTQIQLTATASSGLPVTYSVADPTVATVSGNVLTLLRPGSTIVTATQAGDANHTAALAVTDTVSYQAASLIRQHWADAIFFDNSSGDYVEWQWYKNGDAVAGATTPYYSESPSLSGQYYVVATNKDSQRVQSCILTITAGAAIPGGIKVSPNPAAAGSMVTVTCNYTSAELQGAVITVSDLSGKGWGLITNVQPSMQVTVPPNTGMYIVSLVLANGQKTSVNVLVVR